MSRDAKNSIALWVSTLVLAGLFWACLHFNVGANIPDRWLWPTIGILAGVDVIKAIWDFFRKRKHEVR